jgi:hypothetical protein
MADQSVNDQVPHTSEAVPDTENHEPALDGLRAWQAAVVRLWSTGEDSFAELILSWSPGEVSNPASMRTPWAARLHCGDEGKPGWTEDVQITGAASIQQALQRLWDRATARHGLFKDDPALTDKLPTDFPADRWLTIGERALLDRVINGIKYSRAPVVFQLGYYPEQRLRQRWMATVYRAKSTPKEGVVREVSASSLLNVLDALLHALAEPAKLDSGASELSGLLNGGLDTSIEEPSS